MIIVQQIFGDGTIATIPSELNLRGNNLSHQVIPLVIISF